MSGIKFPKARQLYDALLAHTDEQTAKSIACCVPLPKAPSDSKRLDWVNAFCGRLEADFDETAIQNIRENSGCTPPAGKLQKVRHMFESAKHVSDFCERFNKEYAPGNSLETDGNAVFLTYPVCYCSCVKNLPAPVPKAWCYCSLGYAKKLFSYAFSRDVRVELLESVKTGGAKCVMKII